MNGSGFLNSWVGNILSEKGNPNYVESETHLYLISGLMESVVEPSSHNYTVLTQTCQAFDKVAYK